MRRAVVLGGTGAIGGAVASRLVRSGWDVQVTGRDVRSMPPELQRAGVGFHAVDRADVRATEALVGDRTDLLVDTLAWGSPDVRALLPVMSAAGSVVLVSSRAVYCDGAGRHLNGPQAPTFEHPVREDGGTVPPATPGTDPRSRAGYAPSKVAAERVALDSGLPVTVLRPSQVHGRWARNARTRPFVERMLAGEPVIALCDRGGPVVQLTAATNVAVLVEVVADVPGRRILNIADPDVSTAAEIVAAVGAELGWTGRLDLLAADAPGGDHPWRASHGLLLDTTAARVLGYRPAGTGLELLAQEVRWLADLAR
ncbi:NAD-dependent epimerase/dehydratase family protein [Cellulomonas sp. URHB0016]